MIKNEYKFSAETESLIAAAMEVHSHLKSGYPEKFYQRAYAIELRLRKIPFKREPEMPVLLINFGARSLQFKRLRNSKFKYDPSLYPFQKLK